MRSLHKKIEYLETENKHLATKLSQMDKLLDLEKQMSKEMLKSVESSQKGSSELESLTKRFWDKEKLLLNRLSVVEGERDRLNA